MAISLKSLWGLITLGMFGCAAPHLQTAKNKNFHELTFAGRTESYFLADRPLWAQFHSDGGCQYPADPRYLDYQKVAQSFGLSYPQLVGLQFMANRQQGDAESIFFSALEKVENKSASNFLPQFQTIAVIWLDVFQHRPASWWKEKWGGPLLMNTPAVFLSFCSSSQELQSWADNLGIPFQSYFLGRDAMSVFFPDENGKMTKQAFLGLDLQKLFGEKTALSFVTTKKNIPQSLKGKWSLINW